MRTNRVSGGGTLRECTPALRVGKCVLNWGCLVLRPTSMAERPALLTMFECGEMRLASPGGGRRAPACRSRIQVYNGVWHNFEFCWRQRAL